MFHKPLVEEKSASEKPPRSAHRACVSVPLPFLQDAAAGAMTTKAGDANLVLDHDVEAKVLCAGATSHIKRHGKGKDDTDSQNCIWMCGSCDLLHNQPVDGDEHVVVCEPRHIVGQI